MHRPCGSRQAPSCSSTLHAVQGDSALTAGAEGEWNRSMVGTENLGWNFKVYCHHCLLPYLILTLTIYLTFKPHQPWCNTESCGSEWFMSLYHRKKGVTSVVAVVSQRMHCNEDQEYWAKVVVLL